MSQVDELIRNLCPDGVEFKAIGEVIENLRTGLNPRQNFKLNTPKAEHFYITVRELRGFSVKPTEKTDRVDDDGLTRIQARSKLKPGDVLFSGTGTIGRTALVSEEPRTWNIKEGVYAITSNASVIDPRFLIYLLHSSRIRNRILASADGSTVASISMATLRGIKIPVPPLEVQREIVTILDQFTRLEADLEAELEARRRQYEHYRRVIVEQSQHGEKLSLGTIEARGFVKLGRGRVISKIDIEANPGEYPVYSSSGAGTGEFGRYGLYMFDDERITWSVDGGGRLFYRHPHKFSVTNVSGWMTIDPAVFNVKYLYYALIVQWERQTFDYTLKAHPSVIRDAYELSIPSIDEQDQVVTRLDAFEALVNDLSVGLPAELAARRKQYEYYRDKLLTFKEAAA